MRVISLELLKSLTALSRLEMVGTEMASLQPLQDLPNIHIVGGDVSTPESVPRAEPARFAGYRANRSLPTP